MTSEDAREVLDRSAPPPDVTVRYGPLPEHIADVRWPTAEATAPAPLVIVVHGGFWRAEFDRRHTGPLCAALAAAGYAVAAIEYRRTGQPGGGWPGTIEDVDAALSAVPALVAGAADDLHRSVDVARTVLLGHSAGGHLVALALTVSRADVLGGVSLGGVLDLQLAATLALDPSPGPGPGSGESAVVALLGGQPDDVPDRYEAADPARRGEPKAPLIALHGDADDVVPIELSRSYAAATGQRLVVLPGIGHFEPIDPLSRAWPTVLEHLNAVARPTAR